MIDAVVLDIGDLLPLGELWGTTVGFMVVWIAVITAMGMGSRTLAVPALAAYTTFVYFATQTGHAVMMPVVYTTLVLVIIGTAMKMWRLEGFEPGGSR